MKLIPGANRVLFAMGLSLPLLALVTMSWLVHQTTGQFENSFYQATHVYKVLNLVQQTQFHLLDAETERRGYLLAGSEEYLDSYGKAMTSLHSDIQELEKLAAAARDSKPISSSCRNSLPHDWALIRTNWPVAPPTCMMRWPSR